MRRKGASVYTGEGQNQVSFRARPGQVERIEAFRRYLLRKTEEPINMAEASRRLIEYGLARAEEEMARDSAPAIAA